MSSLSKDDSEKKITEAVVRYVGTVNSGQHKKIKQEYNNLRDKFHGEDLVYEIANRIFP